MTDEAWEPDEEQREVILQAVIEACQYRDWSLLAAHVRTTHVHVVVQAEIEPELIMNALKSYASRALNRASLCTKRWARHGSTLYLWTREEVANAVQYIVEKQGPPMALYRTPTVKEGTPGAIMELEFRK